MRPNNVKCVAYISKGNRRTWCKGDYSPFFISIDHAAINDNKKEHLIVCGECRHEIIKALSDGCKYV